MQRSISILGDLGGQHGICPLSVLHALLVFHTLLLHPVLCFTLYASELCMRSSCSHSCHAPQVQRGGTVQRALVGLKRCQSLLQQSVAWRCPVSAVPMQLKVYRQVMDASVVVTD